MTRASDSIDQRQEGRDHDMDELIDHVARRAGLTREQARAAVEAMLGYFTAKLPSPVVGRMREVLRQGDEPSGQNAGTDPPAP